MDSNETSWEPHKQETVTTTGDEREFLERAMFEVWERLINISPEAKKLAYTLESVTMAQILAGDFPVFPDPGLTIRQAFEQYMQDIRNACEELSIDLSPSLEEILMSPDKNGQNKKIFQLLARVTKLSPELRTRVLGWLVMADAGNPE